MINIKKSFLNDIKKSVSPIYLKYMVLLSIFLNFLE